MHYAGAIQTLAYLIGGFTWESWSCNVQTQLIKENDKSVNQFNLTYCSNKHKLNKLAVSE